MPTIPRLSFLLLVSVVGLQGLSSLAADIDDDSLKKAVTFYASFDEAIRGDYGGGDLTAYTGIRPEPGKPRPEPTRGASDKAFGIARGKGVAGGCLEAVDNLPKNGRLFFPAKGNIAFKKGGWGGTVSVWINFDPDKMLKLKFCDPVQITQKGANNGGIWFDFNDAKPRDMRHGAFPAVKAGEKAIAEEDPKAPMVRVPKVGFKSGDWHHIVLSWKNFDTGKPDAVSAFYVDGKLIGEVKDRAIGMDWDIDQAGIFFAVGYIGLLDELAMFNRPLTAAEVNTLKTKPGLLVPLKKAGLDTTIREMARIIRRTEQLFAKGIFSDEAHRWHQQDKEKLQRLLASGAHDPITEEAIERAVKVPPTPGTTAPRPPQFPFDATAARKYQEAYAGWLGVPVEFTNRSGMTFRLVPPGTFLMGSPDKEPGHRAGGYDETLHPVTLSQAFFLATNETNVGQFRRFVEATDYVTDIEKAGGGNAHDAKAEWKHRPGTQWRKPGFAGPFELRDHHPVVHVSWTDAKNFCAWLNKQHKAEGLTYDLPSESQWEWACRAGSKDRFWWGPDEDTTGKVANVGDQSLKKLQPEWPRAIMAMDDGHAFLAPVGSYRANGFGLHDMLGNAWEFCSTHYGDYPKGAVTDPGDGDPKRGYAVRGGGWSNSPNDARCASRNADPPHFGHSNLGFRVALVLPAVGK